MSRDIGNKLSHLAWNDWNHEVREAAMSALGNTDNGRLLHRELANMLRSKEHGKQVRDQSKFSGYIGRVLGKVSPPFSRKKKCLRPFKSLVQSLPPIFQFKTKIFQIIFQSLYPFYLCGFSTHLCACHLRDLKIKQGQPNKDVENTHYKVLDVFSRVERLDGILSTLDKT